MNNTANLIVHIGPPKTATTSLQYFFQTLGKEEFVYCGVNQPREKILEPSLCNLLYKDIEDGVNINKPIILERIDKLINENKKLIFSEEMFLLNSNKSTWQDKIKRLYAYLHTYEPTVIFTLRNPRDVIPSYFQELYNTLDDKYCENFNYFVNSNYCQIYRYEYLKNFLTCIGFKKIKTMEYTLLSKGAYQLSDLMESEQNIRKPIYIKLPIQNISKIENNKRYSKPVSIKLKLMPLVNKIANILPKRLKLKEKGVGCRILKFIPDFKLPGRPIQTEWGDIDLSLFDQEWEKMKTVHPYHNHIKEI